MEDFVEQLARGNVTEVKVVLASIVVALAVYQVFLMAVVYGKLRLPFLASRPASFTHRAAGDTIVIITAVIAFMCLSYFGIEDGESDEDMRAALHVAAGSTLLTLLAQDRSGALVAPNGQMVARAGPDGVLAVRAHMADLSRRFPRRLVRWRPAPRRRERAEGTRTDVRWSRPCLSHC